MARTVNIQGKSIEVRGLSAARVIELDEEKFVAKLEGATRVAQLRAILPIVESVMPEVDRATATPVEVETAWAAISRETWGDPSFKDAPDPEAPAGSP